MRHATRMVFVALLAVLAISAVAASSALASPEWYVKKKGTFEKVKENVNVTIEGTLEAYDSGSARGIVCNIENSSGQVKVGGAGSISELRVSNPSCQPAAKQKSKLIGCKGGSIGVEITGLPLATSLYKEGTEVRQKIATGGDVRFECAGLDDECLLATSTHMINNVSGGLVEAGFDTNSGPKTTCSLGGKEAGEFGGTMKFKPTAAEKTKGIEAIKVE